VRLRSSWLTVAALGVLVALPAGAPARVPDAVVAATCVEETKRLKTFERGMKAAKRRFFRTHRSAKARKRFVRQQSRKLAQLKRARKRCLARRPVPAPPARPAPAPPAHVPAAPAAPAPPAPAPPAPAPPAPPPTPHAPLATTAIADVVSDAAQVAPTEVTVEHGVEYVRTQLELELEPEATVAQMEALLAGLNAEVVSSLAGVGVLTVRIPDPGSLGALRSLAAGLAGTPGLERADVLTVPAATELPDIVDVADVRAVRPQLASRAAPAWNVRGALTGRSPPTLVFGDFFGAGPPGPEVAVQETAADFATNNPLAHGYTILGLAAAAFEPGAVGDLPADQVTGMWPGPDIPLRVVDLRRTVAGSTTQDRLLQMIGGLSGDVVVNTSFEDGCARAGCTAQQIEADARQWIRRVRDSGLEGRFLHVSAAGNIYPDLLTDTQAALGGAFNAAALTPPPGVAPLANTIVVENTTSSDPAAGPVVPLCLTATSKRGGQISAVGNDIKSFGAPGVFRDLAAGGTSSAAPQVAGAAATVWALAPSLTPSELVALLRTTARPVTTTSGDPRCGPVQAAPALDFYAAVLAADGPATQPARAELLDADGDGTFDEQDLQAFRDAFVAAGGAIDYGRFDLNGDGRTGGGRDRFDLDASSPPAWTFSRRREVLGLEVGHDETDVRDLDVLCHEAHGPLYGGGIAERDLFAEQFCLPPVEIETDPSFPSLLNPGQSATLRIRARRTDLSDPAVSHQPGVHLEFRRVSGTVSPTFGTTGIDGTFSTTASLEATGDLEFVITAHAGGPTGPVLDQITVTAARGSGPFRIMEGETFLVANAEADADVKDSVEPNYSDTVSAADRDATASASLSTALDQSSAGFTFTGVASINASDDGGGGDASAFVTRRFLIDDDLPYRIRARLQGSGAEETFGRISIGVTGAPVAFFDLTTFESKSVTSLLGPGDYTLTAEVGCTPPRPDGGACSGGFDFDLDVGDFVTP
jgi:hypothetical protein